MEIELLKMEMEWSLSSKASKDILLVVRDAHEYVKNCVNSIFANTKDFRLHIWDNASSFKTREYLNGLAKMPNVNLTRSETNEGFVIPNNRMVSDCSSDWIILLNSDTEVLPMWDEVMIGVLKNNPHTKQVGFAGGILDDDCRLLCRGSGFMIDYVFGYCFCMAKETVSEMGLFDEQNIKFAYCEDSDLSLRIRERGWEIYSCVSDGLVRHYGGRTTSSVIREDERLTSCARKNLEYLKERWSGFIGLYGKRKTCYSRGLPKTQESEKDGQDQGQEV